jgi:hypothetical protein
MPTRFRRNGEPIGHLVVKHGPLLDIYENDTIGACLMRASILILRHDNESHPRGMYCGMGVCYECLVTVDDVSNVRACMTTARDGMIVSTDA